MRDKVIFLLLIFLNLYNPYSIFMTMGFNVIALLMIGRIKILHYKFFNKIIFLSTIILLWVLLSMTLNLEFSTYIFGRYSRVFIQTLLLFLICTNLHVPIKHVLNSISIVLITHIFAIGLQSVFPSLNEPMAYLFNYDRGEGLFELVTIRSMGLTGSYDIAGLMAVTSMCFFSLKYESTSKYMYLLLFCIAFLSCLRISRTTMMIGFVMFIWLFFKTLRFSFKRKYYSVLLFSGVLPIIMGVAFVKHALPIIGSSLAIFSDTSLNTGTDISVGEYSQSDVALFGSHLILPESIINIIIGMGADPHDLALNTDIGYIRIIYSIGVIGLILTLLLYYHIFKFMRLISLSTKSSPMLKCLSIFILYYIIMILLFNYKLLMLYSRGIHDFLLILTFTCYGIYIHQKSVDQS